MVDEMVSLVLERITPMANRRSAVVFSGPYPLRIVHRSSSQFQSRGVVAAVFDVPVLAVKA